eukprot:TRINITY_DN5120_c0_g1_i4.p1 TRINITY_DN5120_c0_g1~~TRINITY_DN5120_c0_g1_i4.p1  ORF type:complete len:207 (-),score=48.31 TRINITY_DN5120_c0_g1_i4:104-724(-)
MKILILCLFFASIFGGLIPFVDLWEEVKDPECMVETIKSFCFRVYQGIGRVEPNFVKNYNKMKDMKVNITLYMIPSIKVEPKKQVGEIMAVLKDKKVLPVLSIVVEGKEWDKDPKKNVEFLKNLTAEFTKYKLYLAIQTEAGAWTRIMGSSTEFSKLLLWWVKHDKDPEPTKFKPFGGWKAPFAKQFNGAKYCENNVGQNSHYIPQ